MRANKHAPRILTDEGIGIHFETVISVFSCTTNADLSQPLDGTPIVNSSGCVRTCGKEMITTKCISRFGSLVGKLNMVVKFVPGRRVQMT